jgi:hypothetical protein
VTQLTLSYKVTPTKLPLGGEGGTETQDCI